MSTSGRALAMAVWLLLAGYIPSACDEGDVRGASPPDVSLRSFSFVASAGERTATGSLQVNAAAGTMCLTLPLVGVTSGHIHPADDPQTELVVLPGSPQQPRPVCVDDLDGDLLADIISVPEAYLIEFHGPESYLPDGAVQVALGG